MLQLASVAPRPRAEEEPYVEFDYPVEGQPHYLPAPSPLPVAFFATLTARRTRRDFDTLSEAPLGSLLWFTSRTLLTSYSPPNADQPQKTPRWEHRVTPSAGGKHPIDVIVMQRSSEEACTVDLYHPLAHALLRIAIADETELTRLDEAVQAVVPTGRGLVLWHLAQAARTLSKYNNGESLVWRDAGCLVATTALVAEALGLACCPLGITGEPHLANALGGAGRLQGVGGCVVGGRI